MVVVVAVVVVGVVSRVVAGVRVMIVAQTRRKAFGGGQTLGCLLLTVTGSLTFIVVVCRTCQQCVMREGAFFQQHRRQWQNRGCNMIKLGACNKHVITLQKIWGHPLKTFPQAWHWISPGNPSFSTRLQLVNQRLAMPSSCTNYDYK